MKMRLLVSVIAAAMLAALAAPAAAQRPDGYIRAFHNSPDTPAVDIYVDGGLALAGVEYGTLSDYVALPTGRYDLEIKVSPSSPSDPAALSTTVTATRVPQTLAAIGSLTGDGGALQVKGLRDPVRTPGPVSRVRVAHTSPDAPAVDVQAWVGGTWTTLIPGLAFGEDSGYLDPRSPPGGRARPRVRALPAVGRACGRPRPGSTAPMETTSTGLVSRIIDQGRQAFGDLDAVEVPRALWEQVMDEVAAAGGDLGFESCDVDGVAVLARPDGPAADEPRYRPVGAADARPLPG